MVNAKRRTYTAEYKLRILAEADRATGQSRAIGALLRREKIYSSFLVSWRRERQVGILKGLTPVPHCNTTVCALILWPHAFSGIRDICKLRVFHVFWLPK